MLCFYASDVHGSEVCWRKFLNAGKFYGVDVLVMGGDIVGKAIVPIELQGSGGRSTFFGREVELQSEDELHAFEKDVRDAGLYPYRSSREEIEYLNESDDGRQALFDRVVRHELRRWIEIADEKHDPHVSVFVMAGNDDPWFVDEELALATSFMLCDNAVVELDDIEMISLSYSNPTPWNSPRELEEPKLYERIAALARHLRDPATAVFNLHVPPYGSGLDEAPLLDETLKPITHMGQIETGPVGSEAVRRAIEEFQPLASLHGHIHESRGVSHIGRTVAINPGSEYSSGRIHGALVEVERGCVRKHQLVTG